jgi:hypothetical protein
MRASLERAMNAATAATAGHAVAGLWNPSTTQRLHVVQIHIGVTAATAAVPALRRATARGTAGASTTSAIENDWERIVAPPSGAILDVAAYSAQPTLETNELLGMQTPAAIGSGVVWVFEPKAITIPASSGLVIVTSTAVAFPISRIGFVWDE